MREGHARLGLFGAFACIALQAWAADGGGAGAAVPHAPPSLETQARLRKIFEDLTLPNANNDWSTIGCLCRASLVIATGTVEFKRERNIDFPGFPGKKTTTVDLTVRVTETLAGQVLGGRVSFTSGRISDRCSVYPNTGTEVIVFLADKLFDIARSQTSDWMFDRASAKIKRDMPLQLAWSGYVFENWQRFMIVIKDDVERDEMLACIREYIRLQSVKDADGYRAFLARQMKSPVKRISDDALWDTIHFYKSYCKNTEDLMNVLQDTSLDKRVKGYFDWWFLWLEEMGKG